MMLGARTGAWAKRGGGVPTAKDYAQDGLIAMWDGIENAGWGIHDPAATVWKDLVGGKTYNLKTNYHRFSDNSFDFVGEHQGADASITLTSLNAPYANDFTCRVVVHTGSVCPEGYYMIMGGVVNENYEQGVYVSNGHFAKQIEVRKEYSGEVVSRVPLNFVKNRGYSFDIVWHRGTLTFDGYMNGGYVGSGNIPQDEFERLSYETATKRMGAWGFETLKTPFSIHQDAFYNRALIAEEIAHNYTIDKARFNLP